MPSAAPGGGTKPPLLCLQLFLFRTVTLQPPHNFTQCTTRGSFPQRWHETLYNMLSFTCLFLLPLLIMVCCYARILLEISRRMGSGLCEWGLAGPGCGSCQRHPGGEAQARAVWGPPGSAPCAGPWPWLGGRAPRSEPPAASQSPPGTCRCGARGTTSRGRGCAC